MFRADGKDNWIETSFCRSHRLRIIRLHCGWLPYSTRMDPGRWIFRSSLLGWVHFHQRGIKRRNFAVTSRRVLKARLGGWLLIVVAFKVYDMDRDGYISNGELFIVLKMMVGNNLKDQQLQQVIPWCCYSEWRLWIRRLWRPTRMGMGRFRLTSFVKWLPVRYDTYRPPVWLQDVVVSMTLEGVWTYRFGRVERIVRIPQSEGNVYHYLFKCCNKVYHVGC